jgi:DNA-binding NtrC family response regulator
MNKIKLLIIDDEDDLVNILAERLRFRGFEADAVTNFSDAVKLLEKKEYNLAIIDVKLKGINGIQLMKLIKDEQKEIKVILITGHGTEEEARKGIKLGASKYLVKPVNIDVLIKEINDTVLN